MKAFIQKLATIQSELKAPKNAYNAFGKYKYRKAEDILEAAKPLLKEHGILLSLSDDIEMIGNRFYVKTTVTLTDGENKHSVTASAREEDDKKGMDGSQITGASSSYARKYALNGIFAIDDTADSDQTNTGKEEQKQTAGQQSTKASTVKNSDPTLLSKLEPKEWNRIILGLKERNKTAADWKDIKPKFIINLNDEALLFAEMGWK